MRITVSHTPRRTALYRSIQPYLHHFIPTICGIEPMSRPTSRNFISLFELIRSKFSIMLPKVHFYPRIYIYTDGCTYYLLWARNNAMLVSLLHKGFSVM